MPSYLLGRLGDLVDHHFEAKDGSESVIPPGYLLEEKSISECASCNSDGDGCNDTGYRSVCARVVSVQPRVIQDWMGCLLTFPTSPFPRCSSSTRRVIKASLIERLQQNTSCM